MKSLLLASLFLALPAAAEDPPQPAAVEEKAPDSPLVRKAFESAFSKDELAGFGEDSSLKSLAGRLDDDRRASVRSKLGEAEKEAKTPADLEAIARAYLLLGDQDPALGTETARVSQRLLEADPKNPVAAGLAADGYYQSGDYASASKFAAQALEKNPDDKRAHAVFKLTQGRGGPKDVDAKKIAGAFGSRDPGGLGVGGGFGPARDDADLPVKLPVKTSGKKVSVPTIPQEDPKPKPTESRGLPPAVPLTAGSLLLLAGGLVWNNWGKQKADELKEEAIFSAKVLAIGGGIALGAGLTAYGLYTIATAVTMTPPMLAATAGGGSMATGGALTIKGAVLAKGAALTAVGANALKALHNYMTGDSDKKENSEVQENKPSSAGKMHKQVERGQAPKSVDRVDRARFPHEKDQVHFKDGSAINKDGTWKHGGRKLTGAEKEWLIENGWKLPK
jgi:tetratricopeptide (TPR) repeat protein